jgi:hypothetical protein
MLSVSKSISPLLTPLPCGLDMTADQQRGHHRRVVREIDAATCVANKEKSRTPLGIEKILATVPKYPTAARPHSSTSTGRVPPRLPGLRHQLPRHSTFS